MFFNKYKRLLAKAEEEFAQLKSRHEQLIIEHQKTENDLIQCTSINAEYHEKYSPLIDLDKYLKDKKGDINSSEQRILELDEKYQAAIAIHYNLEKEINLYEESLEIGSFGLYKPQFSFDTSDHFKLAIERNYEKQKQAVKGDIAVECHTEWLVHGSRAEGKRMTNQFKKLILYAFNGECDGLIAKVKWNNAEKSKERINKAFENINKLGGVQNTTITKQYLDLKLEELALTYEYELKKYEEKEEQRLIREQMREEEKAQKELERAQKEAEDEERRYQKALEKAKQELSSSKHGNVEELNEQIKMLEEKLQTAHDKKDRAIALAQLTKVGHIYIVSNIGSFGEDVYKIGMTRRLDPLDRVKELGDASVPFQFDIHAIIYSENAPQLEFELHKKFGEHRLNKINNKKEFFRVSLGEIEEFVKQHTNAEIMFTKLAEAKEYRETMTLLEQLKKMSEPLPDNTRFPKSLI